FNDAAYQHLQDRSLCNQGRFPGEVYGKILTNTDEITYNTCAKVSSVFRAYCQENVRFGKDLIIIDVGIEDKELKLTLLDRNTGNRIESGLNERSSRVWSPIVGMKRPSIMTGIRFMLITPSLPIREAKSRSSSFTEISPFSLMYVPPSIHE